MQKIEALKRTLAMRPEEVEAAVALAQQLSRRGTFKEATAVLMACEEAIVSDPLSVRRHSSELARLRGARIELGLYSFAQTSTDEWISWPAQRLDERWRVSADPGRRWVFDCAAARQGILVLQQLKSVEESLLCAIDLATGKEKWRRRSDGRIVDLRFQGAKLFGVFYSPSFGSEREASHRVEIFEPNSGEVLAVTEAPMWCYRRPLLELDGRLALVGREAARGEWSEDLQVGFVDEETAEIKWKDAAEVSAGQLLVAAIHCAPNHLPPGLVSEVLGPPYDYTGQFWLHRSDDMHFIVARQHRLDFEVFRVGAQGELTKLEMSGGFPRDMVVLPRFYKVGGRHIATLSAHEITVPPAGRQLDVHMTGREIARATRDLCIVQEGRMERRPSGHSGASQALIAGGVWFVLRPDPVRLLAYTTSGASTLKLFDVDLDVAIRPPPTHGTWQRPLPPVANVSLPFGRHLVTSEGSMLRGFELGL